MGLHLGREDQGVEEGRWHRCFRVFVLFCFSPLSTEGEGVGSIPSCQTALAPSSGRLLFTHNLEALMW